MKRAAVLAVLAAALGFVAEAGAQPFEVQEVDSIASLAVAMPGPQTIAFSDHKTDTLVDANSGLMRFSDWATTRPAQKQLLNLFPSYDEPTITLHGGPKTAKKKMHVYVAEARFELNRAASSIDPAKYVSMSFLERMDPAIKHKLIAADEVVPNQTLQNPNRNPARRWCEGSAVSICIQSRYQLEGRLPLGIALVNKLREGGRKIADFVEFQSELRVVPGAEIDQAGYRKPTGVDAPVASAIEQNIVNVNQIMQFGKLLAIFQPHPNDANRTIVSAFIILGVETDLFEKKREYGNVPVLRNLIPAQVLAGKSSFNSGNSISAGLPSYARNRIKALAEIFEHE
jgi:hypothetical protein